MTGSAPTSTSDWFGESDKSIQARLEATKAAQAQIRFTLGAMALISMMMLIASYNAYLSYDSTWIESEAQRQFSIEKSTADILTEQGFKNWVDSRNVLISLLGIRVMVDDAPVLGTLSLLLLALWLVLVTRGENHTIGALLRNTDTVPSSGGEASQSAHFTERRWLILHSIESNSPFVNLDDSLAPIESLKDADTVTGGWLGSKLFKTVGAFFFYFPVVVCLFVFTLDRLSYLEPSPFTRDASVPGLSDRFFWRSLVAFFVCWVPLWLCCWWARRYSIATEAIVREYAGRLRS